ncbi:cytochrome c-type biogenesis protein [Aureimonas pseudogalii]|uniref:Cytochrome c-type biogenesis protein n=1 Tax=Aureimonas pseudogalii TaxID=1744844 RepID=A0A7W6EEV4_9HYPH|nr:cytochrome c-type biogenesis protein [Aureimonas pseudogalii]MBB3996554.1 cytochrome c-type biogenesis protein CcmH [Aureimonas pseudogalii]
MIRATVLAVMLGLATLGGATSALAVQPDEVLADPALEVRARALSGGLRCMVCQNQSIDDSDAPLAKDLRVLVRQRLAAGDSDGEVLDYLVSRYGQFVLLRPRLEWETVALWGTPVLLLTLGAGFALAASRRSGRADAVPLSPAEEERLVAALNRHSETDAHLTKLS